ncbi:class I adenylate-forming enzyme family protein [Novosphingopyxis baekryungensis]|uniref:class I adenylate-forming enzyme family protein n=1 Tax=Novosphingopyxis baekryungensis TaxID=279369 RepID=UPI0003B3AB83|nr:AMP-binding protein [Novosphingopyxis baekryungensis]
MNIALFLEMAAEAAPDRIALVCDGRSFSYAQLLAGARGAATMIAQSHAEHVALLDEASEAAVFALFGAALAGVPYVPLNYRLADADLAALLQRITPCLLVGDVARARSLHDDERNMLIARERFTGQAKEAPAIEESDAGLGTAVQLFTSGTTGMPKAAILRHTNLTSYVIGTVDFGSAPEGSAGLVTVPPYHIAGIAALLTSIYSQRKIILLPAFTPEAWLDLVADQRVTNAFVVPTMLARIVDVMDKGHRPDMSSLKAISYGGGKMPLELISLALDLFPETGFTNAYGLTETSSTVALLSPEDHRAAKASNDPMVHARLASVGIPLPTIELEIRDEDGKLLGRDAVGEIYVRGEQVSGEYKEKSALTADGWFPTRDAGYLDRDGYLFLSGRADDVIVRGGENLSPGEIEDVLLTHPAVTDACATGIPSHEWGETVGVALVLSDGNKAPEQQEIQQLVRDRLRSSRVPEQILFVESLPYNEMGKLLRREVKTWFKR